MAKFNLFGNWYTLGQVQEDSPGWVYGLFLEQAVEEEDMWQNIMDQTEEEAHISDLQQSEIPKEHIWVQDLLKTPEQLPVILKHAVSNRLHLADLAHVHLNHTNLRKTHPKSTF